MPREDLLRVRVDCALEKCLKKLEDRQGHRALALEPSVPCSALALAQRFAIEVDGAVLADARVSLELARDYNPGYWPTLLSLGILEKEQGNRLESISLFRQVIENHSTQTARAEANYRIGEIYVALGKRDRALEHLMAAVTESPEGEWGAKSEEYLKLLR